MAGGWGTGGRLPRGKYMLVLKPFRSTTLKNSRWTNKSTPDRVDVAKDPQVAAFYLHCVMGFSYALYKKNTYSFKLTFPQSA